ncbi:MAG: hypothetical protein IPI78_16035 [Chitinophagaceae bacterium]|nr:hypothetical protein [Chitinophagaceae bacterium]
MAAELNYQVEERKYPFKWGGFWLLLPKFKGCIFGIMLESHPALHNPDYDFQMRLLKQEEVCFMELLNWY